MTIQNVDLAAQVAAQAADIEDGLQPAAPVAYMPQQPAQPVQPVQPVPGMVQQPPLMYQQPAPYQPPEAVTAPRNESLAERGNRLLALEVENMRNAIRLAEVYTSASFCPDAFRGKVQDAAMMIMRGVQLGFGPSQALQAFFTVHGRVGLTARAMVAVVEYLGHEMWEEEAGPNKVVWKGRKKGSEHVFTAVWTRERAAAAGLMNSKNVNWTSYTQEMLTARAQGELARKLAPGALLGLVFEGEMEAVVEQDRHTPPPAATTEPPRHDLVSDLTHTLVEKAKELEDTVGEETVGEDPNLPTAPGVDTAPAAEEEEPPTVDPTPAEEKADTSAVDDILMRVSRARSANTLRDAWLEAKEKFGADAPETQEVVAACAARKAEKGWT